MKGKHVLFLALLSFLSATSLIAQEENDRRDRNERKIFGLGFSYGYNVPAADMADRFGGIFSLGFDAEWITAKNSIIFGWQTRYLFGGNVKEDVLAHLRTDNGSILNINNLTSTLTFSTRGLYTGLTIGKIFSFLNNTKSGIKVSLTAGMLEHHIKISENSSALPQIWGPYHKGYDRKTMGVAFQQFIGYQHMGTDNLMNVFAGLEFTQGFGKNVRPVNFDTQTIDNTSRTDLMISLRAGFILPLYSDKLGENVTWY